MKFEECLIEICSVEKTKDEGKDARELKWANETKSYRYSDGEKVYSIREKSKLFAGYYSRRKANKSPVFWVLKGITVNNDAWVQVGGNDSVENMLKNDIWDDSRQILFRNDESKPLYKGFMDNYDKAIFYEVNLDRFFTYIKEERKTIVYNIGELLWNIMTNTEGNVTSPKSVEDVSSIMDKVLIMDRDMIRQNSIEALIAAVTKAISWNANSSNHEESFYKCFAALVGNESKLEEKMNMEKTELKKAVEIIEA